MEDDAKEILERARAVYDRIKTLELGTKYIQESIETHRMSICGLAVDFCQVGYRTLRGIVKYNLVDFCGELDLHRSTLQTWLDRYYIAKHVDPELYNPSDRTTLERTRKRIKATFTPQQISEVYRQEKNKSYEDREMEKALTKLKSSAYYICDALNLHLVQESHLRSASKHSKRIISRIDTHFKRLGEV